MGLLFDPREVFEIAVRIEVNGEKFYRAMADKLDDPGIRELFSFLADEEVGHRRFYEGLAKEMEPFEPEESYPGEYFGYLRAYADGIIFSQAAFEEKLESIDSAAAAVDFAISVEWDSIHYYQELKGLVTGGRKEELEKLISEERKHFVRLSELKREKNY